MSTLVSTGPDGTTIHLPPFPNGTGAVLWLIAFGLALFLFLAALKNLPRRRALLDLAGRVWERIVNLGRRSYLLVLIALGLFLMTWAIATYFFRIPPLIGALLSQLTAALSGTARGTSTPDDVRSYAYAFAAVAGSLAFLATVPFQLARVWINERNARNAEENLTTDLINKAVEGLGAEKTIKRRGEETTTPNIEVRIGAIYQLERIAHNQAHSGTDQGARDHIRIMEILCAYIRENAPASKAVDLNMAEWPDYPENPSAEDLKSREDWREARARELDEKVAKLRADHTPRTDIQTALTVLGRRDAVQIAVERNATRPEDRQGIRPENRQGYRLDLCAACLQAADLSHHDLERADLSGARLEGANLYEARLEGANLYEARLERANLVGARLEEADLVRARLEGANLVGAVFKSANWAEVTNDACPAQFADFRGVTDLDQARLSSLVGNAATLLPDTPPGLFVPHKWATEPPGFDLLLAEPSRYGFESADDLRAAFLCGPGEVPLKTGAPWPVDAAPPWGAQEAGEVEWDYLERIDAWAKAHPPTEPVP